MANPMFQALSGGGRPNMMQMLQQLKANPVQFMMERKFNIPSDIANDPNKIVNHLLQTGQVSQEQINRVYQQMGQFKR